MELVLKTSGQQCLAGSNPAPSAQGHKENREREDQQHAASRG